MSRFYDILTEKAQHHPELMTILEGETRWSLQTFIKQIDDTAAGLIALGVEPGESVGLMLYNQKEFLVSFFALRRIGAVVVPINILMLPQDIAYVVQNAGLRRIVVDQSLHAHVAAFPLQLIVVDAPEGSEAFTFEALQQMGRDESLPPAPPEAENDLAFLIYTSGTSGHPKGVMLSEKNMLSNITGFLSTIHFDHNDHILLALPLFHAYGLIIAMVGMLYGGSLILAPKFNPKTIVNLLLNEEVTIFPLVPTMYSVVLGLLQRSDKQANLQGLRFCISGGASLPEKLLQQVETTMNTVVIEGYGMTEAAPVIAVNDPEVGSIPNCVGMPISNVTVKIVTDDGSDVPQGQEGEVIAKGDNIMLGYYKLPEETAAVLTPDGWLKTGDLGYLDNEGRLYISGRKKDLIIKAGENISPRPIEEALYHFPGVREAAVIGVPDEKRGELIVACLSPGEGVTLNEADVLHHCRQALNNNAYVPDRIVIMDDLPKNPTGKILKKMLIAQLGQQPVPSAN